LPIPEETGNLGTVQALVTPRFLDTFRISNKWPIAGVKHSKIVGVCLVLDYGTGMVAQITVEHYGQYRYVGINF